MLALHHPEPGPELGAGMPAHHRLDLSAGDTCCEAALLRAGSAGDRCDLQLPARTVEAVMLQAIAREVPAV